MTTAEFLARLDRVRPCASGWMAQCPSHPDATASLSVSCGEDGKTLVKCFANCETGDILSALGLTIHDLFNGAGRPTGSTKKDLGPIISSHDYADEQGVLISQVCRYPNKPDGTKVFLQRRPDGHGGFLWGVKGVRPVPYRLAQLAGRDTVIIVEGEKDADRLWREGLPATTNACGAGKWRDAHTEALKAIGIRRVVVLADNDPPGEAHAIQVARSCDGAGLLTKRILLPGLPPKGDVSDWLDAGQTVAALKIILRAAPLFRSHQPVAQKPKLAVTTLADFLAEPDPVDAWLVDDRIPCGGLVLLAGKPKAGKSTLARSLAFCVASGTPWMGHHVTAGPVLYLALEDKGSEIRRHLLQMGATGREPISLCVGEAPAGMMTMLEEWAKADRPALIIVDTLQRLIQVADMNDYAEVTTKFAPLLKIARETGAALVAVHHAKKFGEGMDAVLGSTALCGSVDNIFVLSRGERDRTLESVQRVGDDLPATVVQLDEDTGMMVAKGSKRLADINFAADLIMTALRDERDAQSERWLREHVEARPQVQAQALRMLLRLDAVYRTGAGRKGDAYLYGVTSPCTEPEKPEKPEKPLERGNLHKPGNQHLTGTVSVRTYVRTAGTGPEDEIDDSLFANPDDDHDGGVH